MSDLVISKSLTLLAGTKKRGRTPERPTITDPRTAPTHCVQFIGSLVKTSGAWRKYSSFYCLLMQDNSFYYRTRCNPCCCKKKYFVFLSISIHMKIIHNSRYDYTELIQLCNKNTMYFFSLCNFCIWLREGVKLQPMIKFEREKNQDRCIYFHLILSQ